MSEPLRSLLVGFGRAGRELHLPCLRKAAALPSLRGRLQGPVGVLDPGLTGEEAAPPDAALLAGWPEAARDYPPERTVVHVCTPPGQHAEAAEQAARHGYRRLIVEKPLAGTLEEADAILSLQRRCGLDLLVVANWLSSALYKTIRQRMESGRLGRLRSIDACQNKARLSRSLRQPGHDSAFDVELPHLAALALALGGEAAQVTGAAAEDMVVGERRLPMLGRAELTLQHAAGAVSRIRSDLMSPVRERRLELEFDDAAVTGYFPASGDDSYSWLEVRSLDGRIVEQLWLEDDPLTAVLEEFYLYYAGIGSSPLSGAAFNRAVMKVLEDAKAIPARERPARPAAAGG
ncbi:Gfo/Idh/MocA family oxidoreductase [Paenibacillus sp. B01]|uniref:Gfo/Idh/MocA family oxidoreductase n=1 Tax=Paenibacillus sp. B01 TaxID=2660554 RepID=UPI00129B4F91|nr:Gfo/Idh/MocA family oxidoreductase [Paenibacillus sp. B01]QGG55159.1 oxidoreductase [Paenibacillus sp. B01]